MATFAFWAPARQPVVAPGGRRARADPESVLICRFDFAARLFDAIRPGLRVMAAPTEVAPVEIAHPVLLVSKPGAAARGAQAGEMA